MLCVWIELIVTGELGYNVGERLKLLPELSSVRIL